MDTISFWSMDATIKLYADGIDYINVFLSRMHFAI